MISYEISMGLAVASVLIYTGSFRISDIVAAQAGEGIFAGAPGWYFLPLFPAFAIFLISMIAEAQRPPVLRGQAAASPTRQHLPRSAEARGAPPKAADVGGYGQLLGTEYGGYDEYS